MKSKFILHNAHKKSMLDNMNRDRQIQLIAEIVSKNDSDDRIKRALRKEFGNDAGRLEILAVCCTFVKEEMGPETLKRLIMNKRNLARL